MPERRLLSSAIRCLFAIGLFVAFCDQRQAVFGDEPPIHGRQSAAEKMQWFESKVRPILAHHCHECHGAKKQESELRLDVAAGVRKGGASGPVIVPGDVKKSRLAAAIRHEGDLQMPPDAPLPKEEADILVEWIAAGAFWPDEGAPAIESGERPHWAFQPIRKSDPPSVDDPTWARNPIDRFVYARLNEKGFKPSALADPRTIVRRLTYDLTGLPPTAEEIDAFIQDCRRGSTETRSKSESPDASADESVRTTLPAVERLVNRLLASPRYGERWGRLWLDVARYADTKGYVFEEDRRYPYAYTYRDYVIRAFNEDLPYDRFVVEQLAADLLPVEGNNERLAALGFLTVGRRFLKDVNEIIDDRIDVVGRGLMGLTLTCARCHDHKYDPVPTADYYSLYGVFASCNEPDKLPVIGEKAKTAAYEEFERKLAELNKKVDDFLAERRRLALESLTRNRGKYLLAGFELDWNPGNRNKVAQKAKEHGIELEALNWFLKRMRPQLNASPPKPELAIWQRLAKLPAEKFAEKWSAVVDEAGREFQAAPTVAAIAAAVAEKKPTTLADVVQLYAKLADDSAGPLAEWMKQPDSPYVIPPEMAGQLPADRKVTRELEKLRQDVTTLSSTHPGAPDRAMVLLDNPQPVEPVVFLRGNPGRRGPKVPRQPPAVVAGPNRKPFSSGSGRLELARLIASPANPLTARVLVNRVWAWHFGAGIVRSPSDFGTRGDPPTHPELIDFLAAAFIEEGWSIKKLHRRILLSNAYLQQSDQRHELAAVDPDNLLLWRQNRRRLDWEQLRDSLLVAAGRLDMTLGGKGASLTTQPFNTRRAVYGWIDRQNLEGEFRTFDFAGPNAHSPQRFSTTQPQQGLFMLNSPFVLEQSRHVAKAACRSLDSESLLSAVKNPTAGSPSESLRKPAMEAIVRTYEAVLARVPDAMEGESAFAFFCDELRDIAEAKDGADLNRRFEDAADRFAQALLLTNEFAFID